MTDREALPTRYEPGSMLAINATLSAGRLDRALQVARWVHERPNDYRPLLCEAMPGHGFSDQVTGARELYGKHRAKVTWVEGQNAARLALLARTLLDLEAERPIAVETSSRRAKAIEFLGGLLAGYWGVGPSDLPQTSGNGYLSPEAWARKRTRLPDCLPLDDRERDMEREEKREAVRDFTGSPRYGRGR